MFGAPTSYFPARHGNYNLAYNPKTHNPDFVHECLSAEDLEGEAERSHFSFRQDDQIPLMLQAALKDFYKTEYHRGHFAAAANYKSSIEAMKATFYLSNISPFNSSLNQGYWSRLEKRVRDLTKVYGYAEIDSGPIFTSPIIEMDGKRYKLQEVIGKNDVSVPTHFFKVIRVENAQGDIKAEAYLVPNKSIPKQTPLSAFRTTIAKVEKMAGIIFPFPDEVELED